MFGILGDGLMNFAKKLGKTRFTGGRCDLNVAGLFLFVLGFKRIADTPGFNSY